MEEIEIVPEIIIQKVENGAENKKSPREDLDKMLPIFEDHKKDDSEKIVKRIKSHILMARKEHKFIKNSNDSPNSEFMCDSVSVRDKALYEKNYSPDEDFIESSSFVYAPWNANIEKEIEKFSELCKDESLNFRQRSIKYDTVGKSFQVFIILFGVASIYISFSPLHN